MTEKLADGRISDAELLQIRDSNTHVNPSLAKALAIELIASRSSPSCGSGVKMSAAEALEIAVTAIKDVPGYGDLKEGETGRDDDWRFRAKLARSEALSSAHARLNLAFREPIRSALEPAEDEVVGKFVHQKSAIDALNDAFYDDEAVSFTRPASLEITDAMRAAQDVLAERRRQVDGEGWTVEHDDAHANGEMAGAAACYALASTPAHWAARQSVGTFWPWGREWWKPGTARRNLVKAGALILAEIERLDRNAALGGKE